MAVIVPVGANADGRREVLGMEVGPSEAEPFWTEFLRGLARRGLRGVKLVTSDAHERHQGRGLQGDARHLAALPGPVGCASLRCLFGVMRNVMAHAGKGGRRVVSAFRSAAFAQDDADRASAQWRKMADQLRPTLPVLAALLGETEADVR